MTHIMTAPKSVGGTKPLPHQLGFGITVRRCVVGCIAMKQVDSKALIELHAQTVRIRVGIKLKHSIQCYIKRFGSKNLS